MMNFKENFLWGGAIASNQCEGGYSDRGLASADVIPMGKDRHEIIQGLRVFMNERYDRYEKPLLLAENAIGYHDVLENGQVNDDYRIEYMKDHIEQMKLAMEDGVDVLGYTI